ncbi:GNAT family N-acetyltransferase [Dyella flava]|uniref:GNAT family N-acetyltransferase n=1 Tax=Dyella flava TaxID=1920170 RepID=A0ABS2K154_9GAMM|nr:GNAT family N-acetyltransferase [Dyella flava]MBM7124967.1 GNAT family N-acetyltransferase [Dyella flava]GLQ49921.1 GNAT family N-acetyltransferase [Dyella flava]
MSVLDRPIWHSLTTSQAPLSEGGALAKRYRRHINVFAATGDDRPESLAALAALVSPGESVYVLQIPEIVVPPGLRLVKAAKGVQMVATRPIHHKPGNEEILALTDADAADMLALATLTEPGPFLTRTHEMGAFIGIRIHGQLVAMAGERMRMPGYTEVSAVCTHPDFRGRGFARMLSALVAESIQARGEQPFLHAWKNNLPAIALYEQLGFRLRTEGDVAVLARAG